MVNTSVNTDAPVRDKPYSEALEREIEKELAGDLAQTRPDYLPEAMFSLLPAFPQDFYSVRTLVRAGRITDFEKLEPEYWLQPEFFPQFEDIGVPLLQNPPEDRWGAFGMASYPAESIGTIAKGETLSFYFFMKSNYLVETYQGVQLSLDFPATAQVSTGLELPDGSKVVEQDEVAKYFDVRISPDAFLLEPNYPLFRPNGTQKIAVHITVKEDAPLGNYAITLDTTKVPEELESLWMEEYLTKYASGSLTKLDKPFFTAFVSVAE
ncbi:hypothetical protein GF342_04865 [Candidatus Woesearchaeota archaeon]|nr:hypothetical protein [Candidatus Woesearchaeota archaeon]